VASKDPGTTGGPDILKILREIAGAIPAPWEPPVALGKSLFEGMTQGPSELLKNIMQGADPSFGFGAAKLYGRPEDENLPIQFLVGALTPGFGEFKALGKPLKAITRHFREFPEGSLAVLKNQMDDVLKAIKGADDAELDEFWRVLDTRRLDSKINKSGALPAEEQKLWSAAQTEKVRRGGWDELKEGWDLVQPEPPPQNYKMDFITGKSDDLPGETFTTDPFELPETPLSFEQESFLEKIGRLSEDLNKFGKTWKGMLNRARRTPIGERDFLDKLADDMIEYSVKFGGETPEMIQDILRTQPLSTRIVKFATPLEVGLGAEAHLINELKIIGEIEKGTPNAAEWYLDALKEATPDLYEGIETVDDLIRSERILMNKNKAEHILSRYYDISRGELREILDTQVDKFLEGFSPKIKDMMDSSLFDMIGEIRVAQLKGGSSFELADELFKAMSIESDMTDQILTEASVDDLHDLLTELYGHVDEGLRGGKIGSAFDDPRKLQSALEMEFGPAEPDRFGKPLHL